MKDPLLAAHQEWLDLIQPVGLLVSPHALQFAQATLPRTVTTEWRQLREMYGQEDGKYAIADLKAFCVGYLEWVPDFIESDRNNLESLTVAMPEFGDRLEPDFAVRDPERKDKWLLLCQQLPLDTELDLAPERNDGKWKASPQARFERLLRAVGVPIGLLSDGRCLRLVHAPQGESSGYATFHLHQMAEVGGRPILAALRLLLSGERLFTLPDAQTLPTILRESRKYQNQVTQRLAEQVLQGLNGLLAGFQAADQHSSGVLLRDVAPGQIYEGLLGAILRTIFLLFAEERGALPADEGFARSYSILGLYERLRADAALYPDTMDQRFGAWPQLLALWRIVHDGVTWTRSDGVKLSLPARRGHLFDPDAWKFLEGRHLTRQIGEKIVTPRVADGIVLRLLDALLLLDEERLSYRALDVEQLGSVYESMMGFSVETALGLSIGLTPHHVVVNLEELLTVAAGQRLAWLKNTANCVLAVGAQNPLKAAKTVDELVAGLGRKISPRTPNVIAVGGRYLQPTEERRRTGAHYTPPQLTDPIVKKTLEPLLADMGTKPTAEQILALKICDPAMGSGAFLVQVCKQLADLLVIAWNTHATLPQIPPDEEPLLHARRLVAQQCLYGVDKNPIAVDLAKLSVWLVTLAKDHPFTFLDHALRCGDSLVGLTRQQIACFNWEVGRQISTFEHRVATRLREGVLLREEVRAAGDVLNQTDVRNTWQLSEQKLSEIRLLGDVCVAAFFGGDRPAEREKLRRGYLSAAEAWLAGGHNAVLTAIAAASPVRPFHWEVEFPEVFGRENPGFDGFVGNPPFAGKNTLIAGSPTGYVDWLKVIHEGAHGNADLVAHFFRRAFANLRNGGTFGLIATNTIGQGDTRATGLREICRAGGQIYAATRRVKWPGLAAVVVSVVHARRGACSGPLVLDGRHVARISAFLFRHGGDEDPSQLLVNAGKSFIGTFVLGLGFTFDDGQPIATPLAAMQGLISDDPRNSERIFPYLGGEELNTSPTHAHQRYIINFGELSETEARRWPELMAILEEKVRPERMAQNDKGAKDKWWQFIRPRPELHEAIRGLQRVLVIARVSQTAAPTFVAANQVLNEKIVVFASDRSELFTMLQSRIHDVWSRNFNSTLKDDMQYTPSACFETFPFPPNWQTNPQLEAIGALYYNHRAELMIRHNEGLTTTYNRFHDPEELDADILQLRVLHDEMDRAVLDAYGWRDLEPTCQFLLDHEDDDEGEEPGRRRRKPWRYRWPDDLRDEVLARLLELNAQRALEEKLAGVGKVVKVKKGKGPVEGGGAQGGLF